MRFTFCLSSLYIILSAGAFNFQSLPRSILTKLKALSTAEDAKASLIETVKRIESECGLFVYDANAKSDLTQAVAEFEAVASPPSLDDFQTKFQGDWRLLCTTVATDQKGFELSKLPFVNEGPLKQIRKSLNRSVKVLQKILSSSGSTTVDRIDHVIEYTPPSSLSEVIEDLPDILRTLNLNPLELTKSTVTLVHKAEVEGIVPTLTTKLSLQRVIRKFYELNYFNESGPLS
jgi:PAP_fibrillin